ncbi:MAG: autotransporter-associated beta strand repeat-containing protein [Bacteroidales bacterium]|nr:autotransporter-associated beta strand repeat-containing protein [Bacteroidales bacterium]
MKRIVCLLCLAMTMAGSVWAQRPTDIVDRGLVAVPASSGGMFVSWRIFGEEYYGVTYNLYRGTTKIASNLPVSNFVDTGGSTSSKYQVAPVVRGVEGAKCAAEQAMGTQYIQFAAAKVVNRNGVDVTAQYNINDIALADLTGDGKAEMIVKRNFGGDYNETEGNYPVSNTTTFTHLEVYNMKGERLWWIDLGPNMVSGPDEQYDAVGYDWDGDGAAEVLMRGADNMIIHHPDGTTTNIGDMNVNTRNTVRHDDANAAYTNSGNEYLLYLEGATGKPYPIGSGSTPNWIAYPLPRGSASDWGDGYGHRSTKHYFGAPFIDGRKPYIFLGRGCYTKHHFKTFEVNPETHKLTMKWEWSGTSWPYHGQGYHNYGIADVDWDGRDEIVFGSMVIDDNGKGLHTTGLGHGDAQHCSDFDPYRHGQEIFACNEDNPAMNYRDGTTGKIYFRMQSTGDDGRALCGNFSNDYPGAIGHSSQQGTISCVADKPISGGPEGYTNNFRIYWDGDLLEEGLDGASSREGAARVFKGNGSVVFTADGTANCNWTKNTPSATGDILGDWREEIVVRTSDNKYIRIYTTNMPTQWRNYTLWHDHQYRQGMVWESMGYNQPPHCSYFLGELENITVAPPPLTMTGRREIANGDVIMGDYNDQQVIVCETNNTSITVNDGASPYVTFFNVPSWVQGTNSTVTDGTGRINTTYYTCNVQGGAFGGGMRLVKQGDGILNLPNVEQQYTGPTDVWAGTLNFDGKLLLSSLWLNRFAELNSDGGEFRSIKMDYASILRPGGANNIGTVTTDSLLLGFGSRVVFDINFDDMATDQVNTKVISIETKNWEYGPQYQSPIFEFVVPRGQEMKQGNYLLGTATEMEGSLGDIRIEGLGTKMKTSLLLDNGNLYLVISDTRLAGSIIWNGSSSNIWDFANEQNFTLASNPDVTDETFVSGDKVLFPAGTGKYNITLKGELEADSVIVDGNSNYTFNGTGSIVGKSKLVKRGKGTLTVNTDNTYTGGTRISGGTLAVSSLSNATQAKGNLGGVNTVPRKFIMENGATLKTTAAVTQGSPMYMQTTEGGIIDNAADFVVASPVSGTMLTKKGNGWMKLNVTNPSLNRLVVSAGTVQCVNCNVPAKTVELAGGTLSENTGSSYTIDVTGRKTSYWNLVTRATYANKLTGTGTVQIYCPSEEGNGWMATRTPINGNWSEFEGTVIPAVNKGETRWTLNNSYGMPKGTFSIPSGIVVTNKGLTYRIGKVTGTGALGGYCTFDNNGGSGVNTWEVGGESSFATEMIVTGGPTNFTKVGECRMTVKGKWDNTGNILIDEGDLSLTKTACLGTGPVTVSEGAILSGVTDETPLTNSSFTINGTVQGGSTTTVNKGTINFGGKNVTFTPSSCLSLNARANYTSATSGTSISNVGKLTFEKGSRLAINVLSTNTFVDGDYIILWTAEQISGLPTLEDYIIDVEKGLIWDTSDLGSGILRVKYDPATAVQQLHADKTDAPIYSIDGRLIPTTSHDALCPGIYIQNGKKFIVK